MLIDGSAVINKRDPSEHFVCIRSPRKLLTFAETYADGVRSSCDLVSNDSDDTADT